MSHRKTDLGIPRRSKSAKVVLVASGTQLRPFSQAVLEASYKAANEVFAETAAKNADFKQVYDSMTAFRGDEYLWWQIAEYAFDTFQIRARTRG